jgi:23S rRNA (guanosine2251-2'-O)-methyltransferase
MYLYGKNSVLERLTADPGSIRKIYIQDNFNARHILNVAQSRKIRVKRVSERDLARIKRADRLQGIVAEVDKFKYASIEELLERPRRGALTFLCLDGINDPHNLGSIIRIAACFGGLAVVIPGHASCEVNDTVMHVASGGENYVPVCMVNNLTTVLVKAKRAGYWIVGTVIDGGEDVAAAGLPFPMCLVMGSEGKGIRHGIKKHLDRKVSLPMGGARLSLNVAMATAVFCHEIARRKQPAKS